MKKRVLVQDSEEPDPETGELNWIEEKDDDEDTGEEEKIYIGKVSRRVLRMSIMRVLTSLASGNSRCRSCSNPNSASSTTSWRKTCTS